MLNIFIPEDIPSLNKGEGAIFKGMLETFKCLGEVKVTLFSTYPEIDSPRYRQPNVEVITGASLFVFNMRYTEVLHRYSLFLWRLIKHLIFLALFTLFGNHVHKIMRGRIWKAYADADFIVCAHDNAFSQYHLFIIMFCKLLKKPVVMYGASISPLMFTFPLAKFFTRICLKYVDLITTREEISYHYLLKLGVNNVPIHVTADKAFLLPPASDEVVNKLMLQEGIAAGKLPLVGMTVVYRSRVFQRAFSDIIDLNTKHEKHVQVMCSLVEYLTQHIKAHVVFLPHSIGLGDSYDDRIVAREIYHQLKNKEKVHVITNEYTPEELKGLIGRCDMFIGERAHSVIGALSMCVPTLHISFPGDYRASGITGKMVGQQRWIYNCEQMKSDTLIAKVNELWQDKEHVKIDLQNRIGEVKNRTLQNGYLVKEMLEKKYGMKVDK